MDFGLRTEFESDAEPGCDRQQYHFYDSDYEPGPFYMAPGSLLENIRLKSADLNGHLPSETVPLPRKQRKDSPVFMVPEKSLAYLVSHCDSACRERDESRPYLMESLLDNMNDGKHVKRSLGGTEVDIRHQASCQKRRHIQAVVNHQKDLVYEVASSNTGTTRIVTRRNYGLGGDGRHQCETAVVVQPCKKVVIPMLSRNQLEKIAGETVDFEQLQIEHIREVKKQLHARNERLSVDDSTLEVRAQIAGRKLKIPPKKNTLAWFEETNRLLDWKIHKDPHETYPTKRHRSILPVLLSANTDSQEWINEISSQEWIKESLANCSSTENGSWRADSRSSSRDSDSDDATPCEATSWSDGSCEENRTRDDVLARCVREAIGSVSIMPSNDSSNQSLLEICSGNCDTESLHNPPISSGDSFAALLSAFTDLFRGMNSQNASVSRSSRDANDVSSCNLSKLSIRKSSFVPEGRPEATGREYEV